MRKRIQDKRLCKHKRDIPFKDRVDSLQRLGLRSTLSYPQLRYVNARNAPQPYLEALYQTIQKQVEKRAVWKVVSVSDTIEDVVVFNISMLSWKNDLDAPDLKRRIEMKLSLVDKFLGCEVNETTGQGQVLVDSSGHGIENGVADVADGAGWFVENVLLHNQYN